MTTGREKKKKSGPSSSKAASSAAPAFKAPPAPKVSQWVKVNTALAGDDEFSVFSVDAAARKKPPVDMDLSQRGRPEALHSDKNPGLFSTLKKLIGK